MKVLSLFTGAGGLDLGLEAAGFETHVAVEMDQHAAQTLRENRDFPIFDGDIHEVSSQELLAAADSAPGEIDLLAGGPPCQPFSKMAYWVQGDTKRLDDPRSSTLEQYLRVLRDTQPRAFLLENVPGLGYKNKDEGLDLLLRTVDDVNRSAGTSYNVAVTVLNAAHFGVPQERRRMFVIGHREGRGFEFPDPTHCEPTEQLALSTLAPYRTAWDALGDLEVDRDDPGLAMTGRWAGLLPSIPEGENYSYHTDRGGGLPIFGWRRKYWAFLLKLSKRRCSWTITAQPGSAIGPFHWESRRLSVEEMLRLQTFPDGYRISGGRTAGQRQLGNAVPSALAEVLGLQIRRTLFDHAEADPSRPTLIPPVRTPVPDAEPVAAVPEEYLSLVGEHSPHPGTGKGYAANRRAAQTRGRPL